MRALIRREFDADRFDVHEADAGDEAMRLARTLKPAIVTLSVELPVMNGVEVCAAITSDESLSGTTVLMITACDAHEERIRAFEAGAVRFLDKGFLRGELAHYADEIVQSRSQLAGVCVLVADDNLFTLTTIRRLLQAERATVLEAEDGDIALVLLDEHKVDVIVTDYRMPRMDGITLLRAIREKRDYASTPVLFLTAAENRHMSVCALDAGANDFIHKPFEATELLARIRSFARLAKMTDELKTMAMTDELTGLLNRRQAFVRAEELCASAVRYDVPLSCIMFDIDHFKRVNDTYGHAAGDHVLKETARLVRENCRKADMVFRIGGEEFLILCPQTDLAGAVTCAEIVRAAVAGFTTRFHENTIRVTVSLGVTTTDRVEHPDPEGLLRAADSALYEAKRAGRDQIAIAEAAPALTDVVR